jgi:hypothetical protein
MNHQIKIVVEIGDISDQRREMIEQEITGRLESLPETFAGVEDWWIELADEDTGSDLDLL